MKASKFSESEIAFVLRQGDEGVRVEEIVLRPPGTCPVASNVG